MKFSIVTISYNQGKYLKECIDSVLSQKSVDFEYIIVDPGSVDGSRELINSYKEIKKVFKKDNGPAEGLNNGFKEASGDYFGFINADDYLLPQSLFKVQQEIIKSRSSFLSGNGLIKKQDNQFKFIKPSKMSMNKMLYNSAIFFQPSTFFSSRLYHMINGFNHSNQSCWDYELFVDFLSTNAKHHIFDENLSVFRWHSDSITVSGRQNESIKIDVRRIFEKYKKRKYNNIDKTVTLFQKIIRKLSKKHYDKFNF
jgi:glycosyltransferase involved in cell wall biosynthesis